MIKPEDARAKLVELTEASSQLWKIMKQHSRTFWLFHEIAWPRCQELVDGEPCVLSLEDHERLERDGADPLHIARSSFNRDRTGDHLRPHHLEKGRAMTIPYNWSLDEIPMVPISLRFDDKSVGSRLIAWVRPDDLHFITPNLVEESDD